MVKLASTKPCGVLGGIVVTLDWSSVSFIVENDCAMAAHDNAARAGSITRCSYRGGMDKEDTVSLICCPPNYVAHCPAPVGE